MEEISDSCSLLALGTNGTVANFNDFLKSTSMRHKWTQFGLQTIKTSPCQKCKCIPDEHGIGKVECIRCMAPRVKYLLNVRIMFQRFLKIIVFVLGVRIEYYQTLIDTMTAVVRFFCLFCVL